jgi:hypothetical protein
VFEAVETATAPLWSNYDFRGALAKYEDAGPKIQSPAGRQLLASRQATWRLLGEFKDRLRADFTRRPYDRGDLLTRRNVALIGKLARATDKELVFLLPYGEITTEWRDLPPAALLKLAMTYAQAFAATDKPDVLARRYFTLALFCRQFGFEGAVSGYQQQAARLQPALQGEMDSVIPPLH